MLDVYAAILLFRNEKYLCCHIIGGSNEKVSLLRLKFDLRNEVGVCWNDVHRFLLS